MKQGSKGLLGLYLLLLVIPLTSSVIKEEVSNNDISVGEVPHAFTLLLTETLEADGEGSSYRSNSFTDGANDFWKRTNTSPEPGSGNNQTYVGKTGSFFWNGEDVDGSAGENPLGAAPGYFMLKTLAVSSYAGGTARIRIDIAADNNGSGTWEVDDSFTVQSAFDSNIATGANSVGGLPSVANVNSGTYSTGGGFYGSGQSSPNDYLSLDDSEPLDGTGDGANVLDNTFTTYSFDIAIPVGASLMSIRFVLETDGGGEVLAFDQITISAESGASAPTSATIAASAFLEGAFNGSSLSTSINGSIPAQQPYNGINLHSETTNVTSMPANAVDWVLVELREAGSAAAALNATKVGSVAGFLMSDGSIKATDGTSNLTVSLSGNTGADFYVVIYHRNHLPIMSANAISESSSVYSIDFTSVSANTYQTTTALVSLSGGKFGMPAGDLNQNGTVDATDLSTWRTHNGVVFSYSGSGVADFNLDGVINAVDRNDLHQKNISKTRQVPST